MKNLNKFHAGIGNGTRGRYIYVCAVWVRRALVRQLDLQRQRKTLLSKIETIVVNFWSIVLDGEGGFGIDVFFLSNVISISMVVVTFNSLSKRLILILHLK